MSVLGPTGIWVDVEACTWTPAGGSATILYGIKSVRVGTQVSWVKGTTNCLPRPIAAHAVAENTTISIETDDGASYIALKDCKTFGVLTFKAVPASQSLVTSPLAKQLVTCSNVIFETNGLSAPSKAQASVTINGEVLGSADTGPAVVITTAS